MPSGRPLLIFSFSAALAAGGAPRALGVDLIGYVPNYRMSDSNYVNNVLPAQLAMLDEVRYFGITATASGGLTTNSTHLSHIQTIQQKINALPAGKRPRLGVTLGGAGEDASFTAIAQSDALMSQFAVNINSLLTQSGAVGVDIDWEHPNEGVELTTRLPAMLARVKQELGASRRLYATMSPEQLLPLSVFQGANAIDGASIMTYDLSWWANGPLFPALEKGQHSLHEYVTEAAGAWTNPAGTFILRNYVWGTKRSIGAPSDKVGVGSPLYARGYNGTNAGLAVEYKALNSAPWTSTDGSAYQSGSQQVWLPGKELLADRIAYAEQLGLQHIIFWELWHDLPTTNANSLLRTAFETRAALAGDFTADGVTDEADVAAWQQHFGAQSGVTGPMGDADNNNKVDGRDFLIWQRNTGIPEGVHAVPEPLPFQMLALIVMGLITRGRGVRLVA
jgi:hypothetical protein